MNYLKSSYEQSQTCLLIKKFYENYWDDIRLWGVGVRGGATTRRAQTLVRAQSTLSLYLAKPNSPLLPLKKQKFVQTQHFHTRSYKNFWLYNFCSDSIKFLAPPLIGGVEFPSRRLLLRKCESFLQIDDNSRKLIALWIDLGKY